ncbi:MAG: GSCFA domain-containing protein [Hyphomicrobiaceae bacterium]
MNDEDIDYFPSYELVASHPMRGMFYEPNLREVAALGVAHVMNVFFGAHGSLAGGVTSQRTSSQPPARLDQGLSPRVLDEDDVVCDEAILEAFGKP